jgi:predicted ATPase
MESGHFWHSGCRISAGRAHVSVLLKPVVRSFERGIAAVTASGIKYWVPFFQGLLAEVEAERQNVEQALTRTDDGLALAQKTGEHWTDSLLHRIRGEILLKRDPAKSPASKACLR